MKRLATITPEHLSVRHVFTVTLFVSFLLSGSAQEAFGQAACSVDDGTRVCVIEPGFATANDAIHGDTTATGQRNDPETVYVLRRDGHYLLNGAIENQGFHLQMIAEEGDGHGPILQPAVGITGESSHPFQVRGDLTLDGLYITHLNDNGALGKNMFIIPADDVRLKINDTFIDYEEQGIFRFDGADFKLYLTNVTARNAVRLPRLGNGRIIDTRGNTPDTLWIENSTFYHFGHNIINTRDGVINFLHFNHNTVYNGGEWLMGSDRMIEAHITNNMLINPVTFPDILYSDPADSLLSSIFWIDSLNVQGLTEADRQIEIRNNNVAFTDIWLDWYESNDTLAAQVLVNERVQRFVDANANIVIEDILNEVPNFTDAPASDTYLEFQKTAVFDPGNTEPPDFRADSDMNGVFDETGFPTVGLTDWPREFDFSYSTSAESYTAGDDGFPLGDLNWFPQEKAQWEAVGVEDAPNELPDGLRLYANYPNPFNPSTTISFDLSVSAEVSVTVLDLLGRKVMDVPAQRMTAGKSRSLPIDASSLASGMYVYRVTATSPGRVLVETGRMTLVK